MQAHSHTHTHGGAAQLEVGSLPVSVSWPSGFALLLVSYSLQSRQRPQPDLRTLDEYTPRQYWSANFIYDHQFIITINLLGFIGVIVVIPLGQWVADRSRRGAGQAGRREQQEAWRSRNRGRQVG